MHWVNERLQRTQQRSNKKGRVTIIVTFGWLTPKERISGVLFQEEVNSSPVFDLRCISWLVLLKLIVLLCLLYGLTVWTPFVAQPMAGWVVLSDTFEAKYAHIRINSDILESEYAHNPNVSEWITIIWLTLMNGYFLRCVKPRETHHNQTVAIKQGQNKVVQAEHKNARRYF